MNKKIIFLILILLSIFIDVKAAGITINNRYYNATSDIVGNGFKYSVSNNTLELNNYNGSTISTLDDLNIIIKGDNYLTSSSTLPLIKAKNLVIIGEGSLNITAPGIAFYADSIDIKNIVVNGSSKTEFISVINSFSLDNVKMNVESGTTLLYGGSNNTINNSIIESSNKWGLRYATNGVTNISNSDINMECSSICINSTATLNFNNTKGMFHGETYASAKIKMNFDEMSSYLVSYDGLSYQENATYNNFPYLKINSVLDNNVDKDENEKEDDVNDNESLDNSGKDQDDLESDSSGNNSNNSSDSISSDSTSNNDKSDDNLDRDDTNNKVDNEETDKDNAINDNEHDDDSGNNNSNINQGNNDKLEEDNSPDSNIDNDSDKETGDTSVDDVYTNNEYENNDEIYTDNEYDNDWNVEVENPKTYDGIGYKVFWLTFSLAGIIALAFLMRYLNGKI